MFKIPANMSKLLNEKMPRHAAVEEKNEYSDKSEEKNYFMVLALSEVHFLVKCCLKELVKMI